MIVVAQTGRARPVLEWAGFAPAATPLLELYFTEPGDHPREVRSGERVTVAFTLRSQDLVSPDITWRLQTQQGGTTKLQAVGSTTVPAGREIDVHSVATIACDPTAADPRVQVSVITEDPERRILFWADCITGNAP